MQIFRFDRDVSRDINDYGSSFRMSRLLLARAGEVRVDCMYLAPNDLVAYHRAGLPQLFCVTEGVGWVQGTGPEKVPIGAGRAAFWTSGDGTRPARTPA